MVDAVSSLAFDNSLSEVSKGLRRSRLYARYEVRDVLTIILLHLVHDARRLVVFLFCHILQVGPGGVYRATSGNQHLVGGQLFLSS